MLCRLCARGRMPGSEGKVAARAFLAKPAFLACLQRTAAAASKMQVIILKQRNPCSCRSHYKAACLHRGSQQPRRYVPCEQDVTLLWMHDCFIVSA